jgi:hypothetical protein
MTEHTYAQRARIVDQLFRRELAQKRHLVAA